MLRRNSVAAELSTPVDVICPVAMLWSALADCRVLRQGHAAVLIKRASKMLMVDVILCRSPVEGHQLSSATVQTRPSDLAATAQAHDEQEAEVPGLAPFAADVGFVVLAAHYVPQGIVSRYSDSVFPVVEGSEAAKALQERCARPDEHEAAQKCTSGSSADFLSSLASRGQPLQAADGSGAWFKCLLESSQVLTRPGSCTPPTQLRMLLMQEFRPEIIHTLTEIVAVLAATPGAVVVVPSAAPADLVNAIVGAGACGCLVPKRTFVSEDVKILDRAARAVTDAIQCIRNGQDVQAAVYHSTECGLYYDLVLPPCKHMPGYGVVFDKA